MDNESRIEKWNARWMIIAGRALCASCLESQAKEECDRQFLHVLTCEADDEKSRHPWVALHDVLDCARG